MNNRFDKDLTPARKWTQKLFIVLGCSLVVYMLWSVRENGRLNLSLFPIFGGYQPSDEPIDAYELSRNPYKLKGFSGVLNTSQIDRFGPDGRLLAKYPWRRGNMKFERMLDEQVAVFRVLSGPFTDDPDEEIAVVVADSTPPEPNHAWRVYVNGPFEVIDDSGVHSKIALVSFEGYYIAPPAPPSVQPSPVRPESVQSDNSPSSDGSAIKTSTQDQQQEAAPIERTDQSAGSTNNNLR